MKRNLWNLRDFYFVLGIQPSASPEDIKRENRLLAKRYHPDVSKEHDAEEKFKEVQQAYSTFKNPMARSYYDRARERAKSEPNFEPERDTYRYWQSPLPPRKSFIRMALRGLIVLFWMLTGVMVRIGRLTAIFLMTTALALFHWVFPFVATVLIAAGLIFEGNPFIGPPERPIPN